MENGSHIMFHAAYAFYFNSVFSINKFSESKIPFLAELKAFKNDSAAFSVLNRIVNVPEIPVSEEKSIPP